MELLIGHLKTFLLEMGWGGGQMGKSTYAIEGVLARVYLRTMGERGSNFCQFGAYVLIG